MKSYIDQAKNHFKDRISNPLIPTFITSWCLLNYQVFIFTFSNLSPNEKIDGISNVLVSGFFNGLVNMFFLPLTVSLIYVFLYPFAYREIMVFIEKQKVKTNKILIPINEENPRTTKEFNELDEAHKKKSNELRGDIQELEQRIEKSRSVNSGLQDSLLKKDSELEIKENHIAEMTKVINEKTTLASMLKENLDLQSNKTSSLEKKNQQLEKQIEEQLDKFFIKKGNIKMMQEEKNIMDSQLMKYQQNQQSMQNMQNELIQWQQKETHNQRQMQEIKAKLNMYKAKDKQHSLNINNLQEQLKKRTW